MKLLTCLSVVFLSGCISTPVQREFPKATPILLEPCANLKEHPQSEKLSDQITVVAENYGEYHKCKAKMKGWIDWYTEQKKIFEEVKK